MYFFLADMVTADHQSELEVGFNYELLDDTFVLSEEEKSETEDKVGDDREENVKDKDDGEEEVIKDFAKVDIEEDIDPVEVEYDDDADRVTHIIPKVRVPILYVCPICRNNQQISKT